MAGHFYFENILHEPINLGIEIVQLFRKKDSRD